jgi:ABC-type multidrug transport system fused ATPase/permease subunit
MENKEALDALKEIREMMNKSTRCLTLSGLSGVFIGVYALVGAGVVRHIIANSMVTEQVTRNLYIAVVALGVLVLAVATAEVLSERKARKMGETIFNATARKLHKVMLINLLPGGILVTAMATQGDSQYITSIMLLFYGLALVCASKYTFRDILYLGYTFLGVGVVNCFFTEYSLILWAVGFGVLHIVYGLAMYIKYEKR